MTLRLTFVGCGDAFGTGGRFHTCFHVATGEGRYLIDCGGSSPIGMKQMGLPVEEIDAIFISHLHGDHFGGLPFLLLDSQFICRRGRPLYIVGPVGLRERLRELHEISYPGTWEALTRFDMLVIELPAGETCEVAGVRATAYEVSHPSGAPPLAYRLEIAGRTVAFSGDTEWVDVLPEVARGSDLFICECNGYTEPVPYHIDYGVFLKKRALLETGRLILTHMGPEMLDASAQIDEPGFEFARDGLVVEL